MVVPQPDSYLCHKVMSDHQEQSVPVQMTQAGVPASDMDWLCKRRHWRITLQQAPPVSGRGASALLLDQGDRGLSPDSFTALSA